jgi:hypothetical protein
MNLGTGLGQANTFPKNALGHFWWNHIYLSLCFFFKFVRVLEYEVLVRDYYIFVLETDLVSVELIDSQLKSMFYFGSRPDESISLVLPSLTHKFFLSRVFSRLSFRLLLCHS